MPHTSVLLSPFWESVDERWVGAALLILSLLTLCSQSVAVARFKSWRIYLVSLMFTMLAAVLVAPLADSCSPREFQRRIMMPQSIGTLVTLQILWIGVTIFFSVGEEIAGRADAEPKRLADRMMFRVKFLFIRLGTALPSPVFFPFLVWVEQNLLMDSTDLRPQTVGFRTGIVLCGLLTVSVPLLIFRFKPHQLIGFHLLLGCLLLTTSMLIPCLTQKINWRITGTSIDPWNVAPIACLVGLFVLLGFFVPQKHLTKR